MEEFFSSFLLRAGMPASAGLSCFSEHSAYLYIGHVSYVTLHYMFTPDFMNFR